MQRIQTKLLREAYTTISLINRMRMLQATFLGLVMRTDKLEHLVETGMIEEKRSRSKDSETRIMLDGQREWLKVGRMTDTLKVRRDRDAWEVMIAYDKEQVT